MEEKVTQKLPIDLARLTGLNPAGVLVEGMNEGGSMALLDDLYKISQKLSIKLIFINQIIKYRQERELEKNAS